MKRLLYVRCIVAVLAVGFMISLSPLSSPAQTSMPSPGNFPGADESVDTPVLPGDFDDDRQQFARSVFKKLKRKLKNQYFINARWPNDRLNVPPDRNRYDSDEPLNILYIYYLPAQDNPYRYFVACPEPDPDICELIDLKRWQNDRGRFRVSADRVSDNIIGQLPMFEGRESDESDYGLLSLLGLSSRKDQINPSVDLADTGDGYTTYTNDTPISSPSLNDIQEPSTKSSAERPEDLPGQADPVFKRTRLKQEAAIHEIIMMISNENFRRAKILIDRLDPDARNHPRLKNLIQQLNHLIKLSLNNAKNGE